MDSENEKIFLHNHCTNMLKRPSKIFIINDVMYKLFNIKNYNKNPKIFSFYESILYFFGCLH